MQRQREVYRALVEFCLIVVGVLAALGVDSYAESRRERSLEQEYVDRLVSDLRSDSLRVLVAREAVNYEVSALRELTLALSDGIQPRDSADIAFGLRSRPTFMQGTTLQSNVTWLELIQTGRLGLINDPQVREALTRWFAVWAPVVQGALNDYTNGRGAPDSEVLLTVEPSQWSLAVDERAVTPSTVHLVNRTALFNETRRELMESKQWLTELTYFGEAETLLATLREYQRQIR